LRPQIANRNASPSRTIVPPLLVEMLTSLSGIAALMIQSQRNFQSAQVYALLIVVGLFGFIVNDLFAIIEAVVLRRWPRGACFDLIGLVVLPGRRLKYSGDKILIDIAGRRIHPLYSL
jgi:hypothetical protein